MSETMIPEHSLRSIGNQTPEEALEPFLALSDDRGRLASYALMLKCELEAERNNHRLSIIRWAKDEISVIEQAATIEQLTELLRKCRHPQSSNHKPWSELCEAIDAALGTQVPR